MGGHPESPDPLAELRTAAQRVPDASLPWKPKWDWGWLENDQETFEYAVTASPTTILALVARCDALEAKRHELRVQLEYALEIGDGMQSHLGRLYRGDAGAAYYLNGWIDVRRDSWAALGSGSEPEEPK